MILKPILESKTPKKKCTKLDIVHEVYNHSHMRLSDVQNIIDVFIHRIKSKLSNDYSIEFRGFGTFLVRTRKGRDNAHNPADPSRKIHVEDHGVVVFRPGKELKKMVWEITETREEK